MYCHTLHIMYTAIYIISSRPSSRAEERGGALCKGAETSGQKEASEQGASEGGADDEWDTSSRGGQQPTPCACLWYSYTSLPPSLSLSPISLSPPPPPLSLAWLCHDYVCYSPLLSRERERGCCADSVSTFSISERKHYSICVYIHDIV